MKNTRKRKTKKGDFGYFSSEKKRRLLITAGLFFASASRFFRSMGGQWYKDDCLDSSDGCRMSSWL